MKSETDVAQSCLTPSNPMDYSLPGSSLHGICQARVLEWGAIAFSALDGRGLKFAHVHCLIALVVSLSTLSNAYALIILQE